VLYIVTGLAPSGSSFEAIDIYGFGFVFSTSTIDLKSLIAPTLNGSDEFKCDKCNKEVSAGTTAATFLESKIFSSSFETA
jgi:hypothetical protein